MNIDLEEKIKNSLAIQKETLFALDYKLLLKTDSGTRLNLISKIEEYWDDKILQYLRLPFASMKSGLMRAIKQTSAKWSILKILKRHLNGKDEREVDEVEKKIEETRELFVSASVHNLNKQLVGCIPALTSKYFEELSKLFAVLFTIKRKLRQNMNEHEMKLYYKSKLISDLNELVKDKNTVVQNLINRNETQKKLKNIAKQYANGEITDLQEMLDQMNSLLSKPTINEQTVKESIRMLDAITKDICRAGWFVSFRPVYSNTEFDEYGFPVIEGTDENDHWSYVIDSFEGSEYNEYGDEDSSNFFFIFGVDEKVDRKQHEKQCKDKLKELSRLFVGLITSSWYEENNEWYYWKPENEEDIKEYTGYKASESVVQCKEQIRKKFQSIKEYSQYQDKWIEYLVLNIDKKYTKETIDNDINDNAKEDEPKQKDKPKSLKSKLIKIFKDNHIPNDVQQLDYLYSLSINSIDKGEECVNQDTSLQALETLVFEHRYKFYNDIVTYPTDEYDIIPVWFDTWQYSSFSMGNNLVISLFDRIFDALGEKQLSYFKWAGNFIKRFAPFLMGTALGINDPVDSFFNSIKNDDYKDYAKEVTKLKGTLHDLIMKKTTTGKGKKLVIFIDNLDRLQPVKAVELLEILKLFFDCPHCVFILAVDENIIIQGVKEKYGQNIADDKAKEFFDKIVQLPLHLPEDNYDLENFIKDKIEIFFKYSTKENKIVLQGLEDDSDNSKEENLRWFVDTTIDFSCKNPRKLKRFLNMFYFMFRVTVNEISHNSTKDYYKDDSKRAMSLGMLKALYLATGIHFFNNPLYCSLVQGVEKVEITRDPKIDKRKQHEHFFEAILRDADKSEGIKALRTFLGLSQNTDGVKQQDINLHNQGLSQNTDGVKQDINLHNISYFKAALESTKFNVQGGLSKYFYIKWQAIEFAYHELRDAEINDTFEHRFWRDKTYNVSHKEYYEDFNGIFNGVDSYSVEEAAEDLNGYELITTSYKDLTGRFFWRVEFLFKGDKGSFYVTDIIISCLASKLLIENKLKIDKMLRKVIYERYGDKIKKEAIATYPIHKFEVWSYSGERDNEEEADSCKLEIIEEDKNGRVKVAYKNEEFDEEVCYEFKEARQFDCEKHSAVDIANYITEIYNSVKNIFENL